MTGDPVRYSAEQLPPGVAIDPTTGLISGTIAPDSVGSYQSQVWAASVVFEDIVVISFNWKVNGTPITQLLHAGTNATCIAEPSLFCFSAPAQAEFARATRWGNSRSLGRLSRGDGAGDLRSSRSDSLASPSRPTRCNAVRSPV